MNKELNFFEQVYEVAKLIPEGKVTTYGAIAKFLGSPQASRMVGWAMNNSNTYKCYIPAHRVVNRNGVLTGKHHFVFNNTMEELLKNEGVIIKNDKIINMQNYFWDPSKELSIN